MDVKYINPFIESMLSNLEKVAAIKAERLELSLTNETKTNVEISGVIGLGGEIMGSVVISFPHNIAHAIATTMHENKAKIDNEKLNEAIGELTNIIVGSAREMLVGKGMNITMSSPTIIIGKDHVISHPQNIPFIIIPFSTSQGTFHMNVGIKQEKEK